MILVDHAGLMTQPEGTIYQSFGKMGLGPPLVFGGPLSEEGMDYVEAQFLPSEGSVSIFGGNPAILGRFGIDDSDCAIWYPSGFGRWGMYDYDAYYLVWEEADRRKLAEWLLDPAKCVAEMNDDPYALIRVDWSIRAYSVTRLATIVLAAQLSVQWPGWVERVPCSTLASCKVAVGYYETKGAVKAWCVEMDPIAAGFKPGWDCIRGYNCKK